MMKPVLGWMVCCLFAGWLSLAGGGAAGAEAGEDSSVGWVCKAHPERVQSLMAALDLERPGLEAVREAVAREDWPAAGEALLAYYRQARSGQWLRREPAAPGTATDPAADLLLRDTFTFYEIEGTVPRLPGGGLDWQYIGPNKDREWALALNRHIYLGTLLHAAGATGNPIYARGLDGLIRDWVLSNPYPARKNVGESWRGLEVSFRPKAWAPVFYGLLTNEAFTPATRLLLLSSLPEHADYLRRFHAARGNWTTMEMSGLALIAVAWPEFKKSPEWLEYASERLIAEMGVQNYPDGAQKELASSYHWVALNNFEQFAATLRHAGLPVPEDYAQGLERMWNYQVYSLQPDGANPLNNDSDRVDFVERLLGGAKTYDRPDWTYIVTNGAGGTPPAGLPSVVFPWAGQVVMRSGWDLAAQYGFFDVGPWGIGHQHNDKLHLSISAGGRELLVDGGRYTYVRGDWRNFFRSSSAHNVVLVDGRGQMPDVRETTAPLAADATAILPELDFAQATFDAGYQELEGTASHTRAVIYLRGRYWIVVDRIETDRPRALEALWHFHPRCTVTERQGVLITTDAVGANLSLTPVGDQHWPVRLVSGQAPPDIQGWYSVKYNLKEPATCAVYALPQAGPTTCAWVIATADGPAPSVRAEWLPAPEGAARLRVALEGEPFTEIVVRLAGEEQIDLGGGRQLDGVCAVLREGQPPLVVHGRLRDAQGRVLASHPE